MSFQINYQKLNFSFNINQLFLSYSTSSNNTEIISNINSFSLQPHVGNILISCPNNFMNFKYNHSFTSKEIKLDLNIIHLFFQYNLLSDLYDTVIQYKSYIPNHHQYQQQNKPIKTVEPYLIKIGCKLNDFQIHVISPNNSNNQLIFEIKDISINSTKTMKCYENIYNINTFNIKYRKDDKSSSYILKTTNLLQFEEKKDDSDDNKIQTNCHLSFINISFSPTLFDGYMKYIRLIHKYNGLIKTKEKDKAIKYNPNNDSSIKINRNVYQIQFIFDGMSIAILNDLLISFKMKLTKMNLVLNPFFDIETTQYVNIITLTNKTNHIELIYNNNIPLLIIDTLDISFDNIDETNIILDLASDKNELYLHPQFILSIKTLLLKYKNIFQSINSNSNEKKKIEDNNNTIDTKPKKLFKFQFLVKESVVGLYNFQNIITYKCELKSVDILQQFNPFESHIIISHLSFYGKNNQQLIFIPIRKKPLAVIKIIQKSKTHIFFDIKINKDSNIYAIYDNDNFLAGVLDFRYNFMEVSHVVEPHLLIDYELKLYKFKVKLIKNELYSTLNFDYFYLYGSNYKYI